MQRGLLLDWLPEALQLRATFRQPATDEPFYLLGEFANYRAHPPGWEFWDAEWATRRAPNAYPKSNGGPYGSVFHTNRIVCAHFNRFAYATESALHPDWVDLAQWITVAPGTVRAITVGDMLAVFHRDIQCSSGRM
ncbi:MAG: hypothetical protein HZA52_18885 [Planctomycetes bacterium]|nr:hypothetical protein [Planctomycetota bacterium]